RAADAGARPNAWHDSSSSIAVVPAHYGGSGDGTTHGDGRNDGGGLIPEACWGTAGCRLRASQDQQRRCDHHDGGNCLCSHLVTPFGCCSSETHGSYPVA